MAFDRLFCPIKSSKSSRRSHKANRTNNEVLPVENSHHNTENQNNATKIPYRFVASEFHAVEQDELSVCPGDVVLFNYEDVDPNGKTWCHVSCLKTKNEGFVPKEILSIEPQRFPQCKKKLPRSIADPTDQARAPHSHKAHYTSEKTCHSNGGSIGGLQTAHLREHQPRTFDMPPPNSLQGSSGCQTFQKLYPDFRHFSPPSYYNLRSTAPQYDRYELDCRPFHVDGHEVYVVMHNFVYREENDLSVRPGDYVYVLNKEDEDWYFVRRVFDSAEGFVPSRFICPLAQVESVLNKGNSTITMKSSNHNDFHTYINHRPERESLPTDQQSSSFQHM